MISFRQFRYQFKELPVTYITIGLCVLIFIIHNLMNYPIVYLLAYYKPLILVGEYWRLLTCGLCHTELWHIFMNLYGIWIYGNIMEKQFGSLRYAILLFGSILGGSLFLLFSNNVTLAVGISGGLYGLMAAMIYIYIRTKLIASPQIRSYLTRLLLINLMINFSPQVAFMAHLGGFVVGMLLVIAIDQSAPKSLAINSAIATVVLMCVLGYAGITRTDLGENRFYNLDATILYYEKNMGFSNHALNTAKKLDIMYGVDIFEKALSER